MVVQICTWKELKTLYKYVLSTINNYVKLCYDIHFFWIHNFLKHSIEFEFPFHLLKVATQHRVRNEKMLRKAKIAIRVLFFNSYKSRTYSINKEKQSLYVLSSLLSSIEICHGHSAWSALFPWTIRFTRWLLWLVPWYESVPQTEKKKKKDVYNLAQNHQKKALQF